MNTLISKDEDIKTSPIYIGYLILKEIEKSEYKKLTIFNIVKALKKKSIIHSRHIIFGLVFLYSVGVIKFEEPYICKA